MAKASAIGLLLPVVIGAGCQNRPRSDTFNAGEPATITFQVDGMLKTKSGAT